MGPALERDTRRIALLSIEVRILLAAGTLFPEPGHEQRPALWSFIVACNL